MKQFRKIVRCYKTNQFYEMVKIYSKFDTCDRSNFTNYLKHKQTSKLTDTEIIDILNSLLESISFNLSETTITKNILVKILRKGNKQILEFKKQFFAK